MTQRRTLLALVFAALAARTLGACGSLGDASSLGRPNEATDAAVGTAVFQPCARTSDCTLLNLVCIHAGGSGLGACMPPTGLCDPELPLEGQCYPDARCDLAMQTAAGQGSCSFRPPARPVFPVSATISLESPVLVTQLFPTSGFSFRWQPYRGAAGTISVVLVTRHPPAFDAITGQITNWQDVAWAWSTAEPGTNGAVDGTVPVRAGHASLTRAGTFGPAWTSDSLPAGEYFWFVYAMQHGSVVATSVAQNFVVGAAPTRPQSCRASSECVATGDVPELAECYQGTCRRRCASDADCLGDGTRCDFGGSVAQSGMVRRAAFCTTTPTTMQRDGGTPDGPI